MTAKKATEKAAPPTAVMVAGSVLTLNPDDLTLGEMEEFEDIAGRPLADVMRGEVALDDEDKPVRDARGKVVREIRPRVKEITALVFLAKRRSDPSYTLAGARGVKLTELRLGAEDPQ